MTAIDQILDGLDADQVGGDERLSAIDQIRADLLHGDDIENIEPPSPLIRGWLFVNTLAVLYGRPGSRKSFLGVDIALHVATGSWWYGHEVKAGDVLYVVAEGASGMGARRRAWKRQNNYPGATEHLHWLPRAVNLLDVTLAQALVEVAATINPDRPPVLIIIDTLARSMPGGDENTSRDMGLVIAAADALRRRTGACVLLVHHSGKDQSLGARGWSGLLGAVDTELELKTADDRIITLTNTKQKDAREQDPLRFVLVEHDTGLLDDTGTPVTSAAIAPYAGRTDACDGLTSKARDVLAALASADVPGGVSNGDWKELAKVQFGVERSTFMQCVKRLVEAGMVHKIGTDARPRYNVVTRENT